MNYPKQSPVSKADRNFTSPLRDQIYKVTQIRAAFAEYEIHKQKRKMTQVFNTEITA
jgi:hypothetical protein